MKTLSFFHRVRNTLVSAAVIAAVIVPSTASAIDESIIPSIGADTGRFNLALSCGVSLPFLGGLKILRLPGKVDIKGIAPAQLGPGQEFWLSQGSAGVILPQWLSILANLGTIYKVNVDILEINIGAAGATPATINLAELYDMNIKRARISGRGTIEIGLPLFGPDDHYYGSDRLRMQLAADNLNGDDTYFNVGPFIAPDEGRIQLRFEGAKVKVWLRTIFGIAIPVDANCKPSKGNSLLSVAIADTVDSSKPGKYEGEPLDYPEVRPGNIVGTVNAPYTCNFDYENGKKESYNLGIAVGGTFPLAVKRNVGLNFFDAYGAITIPPETMEAMSNNGISSIRGYVHELNLFAENGYPDVLNVLPGGTPISPISIGTTYDYESGVEKYSKSITVLPEGGPITAGTIFVDNKDENLLVGMGTASATMQITVDGVEESAEVNCDRPVPDALLLDAESIR